MAELRIVSGYEHSAPPEIVSEEKAASADQVERRESSEKRLYLGIRALMGEIYRVYGARFASDESGCSVLAETWTKLCREDGWDARVLRHGWQRYRQDTDQAVYAPSYPGLVQAAQPDEQAARALVVKLVRVKSNAAPLSSLSRQEYHVYQQCVQQLEFSGETIYRRVRRWMLEAWMLGDERLSSPPAPVPESRQLPSRVEIPATVQAVQRAAAQAQYGALLAWCPNSIYRSLAYQLLNANDGDRLSPLVQQIVVEYLMATDQVTQAWETPTLSV